MPGVVMAVMHWSVEVMLEWPQVGQERRMRMHIVGLGVCFLVLGVATGVGFFFFELLVVVVVVVQVNKHSWNILQ